MKSISKLRHIQESNLRLEKRYLIEQTTTEDTIIPNLSFFYINPKGSLVVDQMNSFNTINSKPVSQDMKSINSDQPIPQGTYFYEFKEGEDGKVNNRIAVRLFKKQDYKFNELENWFYLDESESQEQTTEESEIVNKVATEGLKNVTSEMISSPPFDGYYSGYVISGTFNNVNYAWDLSGVEGMLGNRGSTLGKIVSETISNIPNNTPPITDASPDSIYVGFYNPSNQSHFICYTTNSNKPKVIRF